MVPKHLSDFAKHYGDDSLSKCTSLHYQTSQKYLVSCQPILDRSGYLQWTVQCQERAKVAFITLTLTKSSVPPRSSPGSALHRRE